MRAVFLCFLLILGLESCKEPDKRDYHSYFRYKNVEVPLEGYHLFYLGRDNDGDPNNPPYSYEFYFYEKGVKPSLHADGSVYRYPKEGYFFHIALSCDDPNAPAAGYYNRSSNPSLQAPNRSYLFWGERALLPDSSDFFFLDQMAPVKLEYQGSDLILDINNTQANLYQSDTVLMRDVDLTLHFEGPVQNVINKAL